MTLRAWETHSLTPAWHGTPAVWPRHPRQLALGTFRDEREGPGESVWARKPGDHGVLNELNREQSRRGVRETKGWELVWQERYRAKARKWRKTEVDWLVGGERKPEKESAQRKIQEIGAHRPGVSRERERERKFNEGNLKASFNQQLAGGRV